MYGWWKLDARIEFEFCQGGVHRAVFKVLTFTLIILDYELY